MIEFFYRIYGQRLKSQIHYLSTVPETAGEAEVKIVFGRMPDFLLEAGQKGYGTWTNGFVSAWFRIRDGTQVYVEGGSRITVELSEEPQLLVITSLLLSAGMALVCLQRGEPFFHGSDIEKICSYYNLKKENIAKPVHSSTTDEITAIFTIVRSFMAFVVYRLTAKIINSPNKTKYT